MVNAEQQFIYCGGTVITQAEITQRTIGWRKIQNTPWGNLYIQVCTPSNQDDVFQAKDRLMDGKQLRAKTGSTKNNLPIKTRRCTQRIMLANLWYRQSLDRSNRLTDSWLISACTGIREALLLSNNESITNLESLRPRIEQHECHILKIFSDKQNVGLIDECYIDLCFENKIDLRPIQVDWRDHYEESSYWGRKLFVHQVASRVLGICICTN